MGLFDGPVLSFATKFCAYLDERVQARIDQAAQCDEQGNRSIHMVVALTLQEVSNALRAVAGIE